MTTATAPLADTSKLKDIALAVKDRIKVHQLPIIAAGIAFWGFLAMVPFMTGLISIYSIVGNPAELIEQVEDANLPTNIEGIVLDPLKSAACDEATTDEARDKFCTADDGEDAAADGENAAAEGDNGNAAGIFGSIFGIAVALWAASGGIKHLMGALNVAYGEVDERNFVKLRGTALLMTLGAIVTLGALGFALGALPKVLDNSTLGDAAQFAISLIRYPILLALLVFAISVLYKFGPDHKRERSGFWRGALVATAILLPGLVVISLFAPTIAGGSFGALGAIALAMVAFLLGAAAVIIGAEWNRASEDPDAPASDQFSASNIDRGASDQRGHAAPRGDTIGEGKRRSTVSAEREAALVGSAATTPPAAAPAIVEKIESAQGKVLGAVMAGAALGAAAIETFRGDQTK